MDENYASYFNFVVQLSNLSHVILEELLAALIILAKRFNVELNIMTAVWWQSPSHLTKISNKSELIWQNLKMQNVENYKLHPADLCSLSFDNWLTHQVSV